MKATILTLNLLKIGIILIFVLTTNLLMSQNISTVREIYDFEVGDIFHIWGDAGDNYDWLTHKYNIEIIDKYYSPNSDTLYYIRNIAFKEKTSWETQDTYKYYIDTIFYSNLDSLINSGQINNVYSDSSLYNNRLINHSVISENGNYYHHEKFFVNGCGLARKFGWNAGKDYKDALIYFGKSSNESHYRDTLSYFKKGSEEWGSPNPVFIKNHNDIDCKIMLYPNPAKTSVIIKSNINKTGLVTICSISGDIINTFNLTQQLTTLDISNLKPDIYIFEFKYKNQVIYKKLVKK